MAERQGIVRVISGGQTGADQAGLLAARDAGIPTGGTAPKGWRTEDGPAPWLAGFGLTESHSPEYSPRTRANVEHSDGTVMFGNSLSNGSRLTKRYCHQTGKPLLHIPFEAGAPTADQAADQIVAWLAANSIRVLNVAGNRESLAPGIGAFVRKVIFMALTKAARVDAA